MNESMHYEGVCRTAPAKLGLLKKAYLKFIGQPSTEIVPPTRSGRNRHFTVFYNWNRLVAERGQICCIIQ